MHGSLIEEIPGTLVDFLAKFLLGCDEVLFSRLLLACTQHLRHNFKTSFIIPRRGCSKWKKWERWSFENCGAEVECILGVGKDVDWLL